jgi:hypothetical protein
MKLFSIKSALGVAAIFYTGLTEAATLTSISVTPSFAAGTEQHEIYISSDPKGTPYDNKSGRNTVVLTALGRYSDTSIIDLSSLSPSIWSTDCPANVATGEIQYGRYVVKAPSLAEGTCHIMVTYAGKKAQALLHVAPTLASTAREPGGFKTVTIVPAVPAASPFKFSKTVFPEGYIALEAFGTAENGSIWPLSLEKKSSAPPIPGQPNNRPTYSLTWKSSKETIALMTAFPALLGGVIPVSLGTTEVSVSVTRDAGENTFITSPLTAQSDMTIGNSLSGLPSGLNTLLFTAGYICNDEACTGCQNKEDRYNKECLGERPQANRVDGDVSSFGDMLYAPLTQNYFGQYYPSNRSNFALGLWTMTGTVYQGLGKLACSPDHQLPAKLPSDDIKILKPGVYCTRGDLTIESGLSLEINQDRSEPLIVQVNGNLTVNHNVAIKSDYLTNAGVANKVYWIVKYDRKTGTGGKQVSIKGPKDTRFYGNIVTESNFTLNKENVLCGRFFSFGQSARVTLGGDTVITLSDPKYC